MKVLYIDSHGTEILLMKLMTLPPVQMCYKDIVQENYLLNCIFNFTLNWTHAMSSCMNTCCSKQLLMTFNLPATRDRSQHLADAVAWEDRNTEIWVSNKKSFFFYFF